MILTSCDLELLIFGKKSTDLLQSLWRYDEIARRRRCGLDRQLHLRQAMPIGCNHAHHLRPKLPQHTVQNRPALLGRDSERRVCDELVQLTGANSPTLVETDSGKRGEFIPRKTEDLEVRTATVQRNALLASGRHLYR